MTTSVSPGTKEPFKYIEIPLQKFQDEALPHHQQLLQQHKNAIDMYMFQKNTQKLTQEIKDKKRNIRQMKDLSYELDTLRAKVYDDDLDKFDNRTFSLRRSISSILKDYSALQKSASAFVESQNEINENTENENPFLGAEQIQIHDSLDKLRLQEAQNRFDRVENLNQDVEGLQEIYRELNTMVTTQKETVGEIERNVDDTHENVNTGLSHLIKASNKPPLVQTETVRESSDHIFFRIVHGNYFQQLKGLAVKCKLKTATYPVTGALIGSLLGGPLGLIAGAKVGGLAALSCGIAGYTGGKFITKYHDKQVNADNQEPENTPEEEVTKKDI